MNTKPSAEEREAGRAEMSLVNDLIRTVGVKMFARENECHRLGIRHFDDPAWQVLNKEHQQLLERKFGGG